MTNLKTLTAAICFATFGFATTAAVAQEGAPAQPPAAQQAAAPISDTDLEKFVEAEEKVAEIREEFTQKLNDAEDQEQAQSLQLEAQEKMMEAVGEVGIDVPVYNQIATRIQSDPELQQRAQEFN